MIRAVRIIGGGIGGLTAAIALSRAGKDVVVFEQAPDLTDIGAGLQLGPNATRALDSLGLGEALRGIATSPAAVRMWDGQSGKLLCKVPVGDLERKFGHPYCQAHRADLVDILVQAARDAGAEIVTGQTIAPDGPTTAALTIAGDGVRSAFRARLNPGHSPTFTGQTAWRALVPAEALDLPPDTHVFLGPGRHLVAYPLRRGAVWNVVAVEEREAWREEGWSHRAPASGLRAGFATWCTQARALLERVEDPILWGLFSHPTLPRWHDDETALLGDACHPMLPFLAQGAAMAIEDAVVLAACLGRHPRAEALAAYEAARKPRTTRVQRRSAANAGLFHMRNPLARLVRNRVMSTLPGARHLSGLDWLYGHDVTRRV